MLLVLGSVVLLLIEFYGPLAGPALERISLAGDVITGIFIVELSLRWFAVIPLFRPIRVLRLLRFVRILRLYRFGLLAHRFAGTFDLRQYEVLLREALARYVGPHDDQVRLAPDLFRMLCNLLDDGRVHNDARALICQALAYFVTPFDVLPEEVHGAEGYLDQAYLCLVAIERLRGELPENVLEEAWEGEGDLTDLVDEALPKVQAAVGTEAQAKILRYVGLAGRAGAPVVR